MDVDECSVGDVPPCKNGATCNNLYGSYLCLCVNGFTDVDCGTNIDDCADHSCYNGGTCRDQVGYYTCDCPPGKTGKDVMCLKVHIGPVSQS